MAAAVEQADWAKLQAEGKKTGAASVVVHVMPVALQDLNNKLSQAKVATATSRLLAELGNEVRAAGRWDNQAGQIALRVSEAGLKILKNTGNAIHFYPGRNWILTSGMSNSDGKLDAIEQQLQRQGFADVQVTLNVEGLDFELDAPGKSGNLTGYRAWVGASSSARAVATQALTLLANVSSNKASDKADAVSKFQAIASQSAGAGSNTDAEFTIRVSREGLEKLSESKDVRSLRLVGFKDQRPTQFDDEVLAHADMHGFADVIMTVRNPLAGGFVSKTSFDSAARANKRTIDGVLALAGIKAEVQDFSAVATGAVRLTTAQLKSLKNAGDARLLQVQLNKPTATTQLITSTGTANFPSAWNRGIRGAGQSIVVMDSGVRRDHLFFAINPALGGGSRVNFTACFGTTATVNVPFFGLVNYRSNCLSPVGTSGDSPLDNALDYSAPVANCSTQNPNSCSHGTHVSGIAAGGNVTLGGQRIQGVANQANIIGVQVFSFDTAGVVPPTSFNQDLIAATAAVVSAVVPNTTTNPFTVNLSLGSDTVFATDCGGTLPGMRDAVQALFNAGVPVIASTGNTGNRTGISRPACIANVIKVGAMHNDASGTTVADYSNLPDPANFPGEQFFLAPGGGGTTNIISSSSNGTNGTFLNLQGTSQAAPHVAGLYALVKSQVPQWTVPQMTAWIRDSASQPVLACIGVAAPCPSGNQIPFRRIRLPDAF